MKKARTTSALGRVEVERHQADELRAYSSFGESLHTPKKKGGRGQKMLLMHIFPSLKERKRDSLTCDVKYR